MIRDGMFKKDFAKIFPLNCCQNESRVLLEFNSTRLLQLPSIKVSRRGIPKDLSMISIRCTWWWSICWKILAQYVKEWKVKVLRFPQEFSLLNVKNEQVISTHHALSSTIALLRASLKIFMTNGSSMRAKIYHKNLCVTMNSLLDHCIQISILTFRYAVSVE